MNMTPRLGYACLNTTLSANEVKANRAMIKRTFQEKGLAHASSVSLQNVTDLETIVRWNAEHNISFYRMSSDMFPWMSEYELDDLPDIGLIREKLAATGKIAAQHHHRLTFHPGPFNVLASPDENVVSKTIKELRQHGEIMDMLELPRTPFAKINIHVGGAYGDKNTALDRFIRNLERLPASARERLTVENDDKANMFSIANLLRVHDQAGIPLVFDYLHHHFCTGDLTQEEAFNLATDTWPKGIIPVVHFSSSKKMFEDPSAPGPAHADYVYQKINTYGRHVDIMLEAKAKELAVLRYRDVDNNGLLAA